MSACAALLRTRRQISRPCAHIKTGCTQLRDNTDQGGLEGASRFQLTRNRPARALICQAGSRVGIAKWTVRTLRKCLLDHRVPPRMRHCMRKSRRTVCRCGCRRAAKALSETVGTGRPSDVLVHNGGLRHVRHEDDIAIAASNARCHCPSAQSVTAIPHIVRRTRWLPAEKWLRHTEAPATQGTNKRRCARSDGLLRPLPLKLPPELAKRDRVTCST